MKKLLAAATIILSLTTLFSISYADADISRERFCEKLISIAEQANIELVTDNMTEISFDDTQNEAVKTIAKLGVMKGKAEDTFAPDDSLTRQEAATALYRYIGALVPESDITLHPNYNFDDNWKIADWAKDAIDYLHYYEILLGTEDCVISPEDNLTEEQAVLLAERVIKNSDKFKALAETPDFEWEIEPKYDGLVQNTWFSGGLCAVKNDKGYGYIDKSGKNVIKHQFDLAEAFECGMARVTVDGKFGYINKSGEMVIPTEYDEYSREFSEDMVALHKDDKFGFADKSGNIVIPFEYDYAYDFKDGIAPVKKDGLYGYIDKSGNVVIDFKFKWAGSFCEGLARVRTGLKDYGYIDHTGEIVLDLKADYAFDFNEGTAVIHEYDHMALIDKQGNFIRNFNQVQWVYPMHDGLIRCSPPGEWYFTPYESYYYYVYPDGTDAIRNGDMYIAEDFFEGLAAISSHSNTTDRFYNSYIDKKGNFVFPKRDRARAESEFDTDTFALQRFSEGYAAVVNEKGKLGFVKNPLF